MKALHVACVTLGCCFAGSLDPKWPQTHYGWASNSSNLHSCGPIRRGNLCVHVLAVLRSNTEATAGSKCSGQGWFQGL